MTALATHQMAAAIIGAFTSGACLHRATASCDLHYVRPIASHYSVPQVFHTGLIPLGGKTAFTHIEAKPGGRMKYKKHAHTNSGCSFPFFFS